jgi:hypothetical protein
MDLNETTSLTICGIPLVHEIGLGVIGNVRVEWDLKYTFCCLRRKVRPDWGWLWSTSPGNLYLDGWSLSVASCDIVLGMEGGLLMIVVS